MAEWISALSTLGALIAAIWAGLTAKKLYEVESHRDLLQADSEKRKCASNVHAWTVFRVTEEDGENCSGILVSNKSNTPITDVSISSGDKDGKSVPPTKAVYLPPGDYFIKRSYGPYHWEFPDRCEDVSGTLRPITRNSHWQVTELKFTDNNGNAWTKDAHGKLLTGP